MTEPQYTPGRHTVVPEGDGYALQAYDGDIIAYGLTHGDALLFAHAAALGGALAAVIEGRMEAGDTRLRDLVKEAGL